MDTLFGIISMTRSERQLPRVFIDQDLDITDVIHTLKGVAAGTDIFAMYNPKILLKITISRGQGVMFQTTWKRRRR